MFCIPLGASSTMRARCASLTLVSFDRTSLVNLVRSRLGRICTDLDAALFFDPDEIRGAYLLTKTRVPDRPPRLNEVLGLIARLDGFLGRKGDGEPGAKAIWTGLQQVMIAAQTLQALRD